MKKFDRGFVSYTQGLLTMTFIGVARDFAPWTAARILPEKDITCFVLACIFAFVAYGVCELLKKPKPKIEGEDIDLDGLELNTKAINEQNAEVSIETKYKDISSRIAVSSLLEWTHFPKRISNVVVQIGGRQK